MNCRGLRIEMVVDRKPGDGVFPTGFLIISLAIFFFLRKITGSPFSHLEMSSVPFQLFSSIQAGWGASIPGLCLTSRMILAVCTRHREQSASF